MQVPARLVADTNEVHGALEVVLLGSTKELLEGTTTGSHTGGEG